MLISWRAALGNDARKPELACHPSEFCGACRQCLRRDGRSLGVEYVLSDAEVQGEYSAVCIRSGGLSKDV